MDSAKGDENSIFEDKGKTIEWLSTEDLQLHHSEKNCNRVLFKLCNNLLDGFSIYPAEPFLARYLFVGIHLCLDMRFMFRFEQMHKFSFGGERILKKCLRNTMGYSIREEGAVKTAVGLSQTSKSVKRAVLSTKTVFLFSRVYK